LETSRFGGAVPSVRATPHKQERGNPDDGRRASPVGGKMKLAVFVLTALSLVSSAPALGLTVKGCSTSDSAICLSLPNCHWDVNRRGCYEGPPETADGCASHESESVCNSDKTLGCAWNAEKKSCATQAK
jgi:hypothetical protein